MQPIGSQKVALLVGFKELGYWASRSDLLQTRQAYNNLACIHSGYETLEKPVDKANIVFPSLISPGLTKNADLAKIVPNLPWEVAELSVCKACDNFLVPSD